MIFLPGGPSHLDIWDLKPDAPVEIRGGFEPIQTSIPGYHVCEHMPKFAQNLDRFTIIRSLVGAKNEHASELCLSGFGYILAGGGFNHGQVLGSTTRLATEAKDRPIHYQNVFATLYKHLGIDVASVKIPDFNGRPQYLLHHRDTISELG